MQDKKFLEFRVTKHEGDIRKELTKRGFVMISERDAEVNNMLTKTTGLAYELAPVHKEGKIQLDQMSETELEAYAKANGCKISKDAGDAIKLKTPTSNEEVKVKKGAFGRPVKPE